MEEAFFYSSLHAKLVGFGDNVRLSVERAILRFRYRVVLYGLAVASLAEGCGILNQHGLMLEEGSAVDVSLIAAPSSTIYKDNAQKLQAVILVEVEHNNRVYGAH